MKPESNGEFIQEKENNSQRNKVYIIYTYKSYVELQQTSL